MATARFRRRERVGTERGTAICAANRERRATDRDRRSGRQTPRRGDQGSAFFRFVLDLRRFDDRFPIIFVEFDFRRRTAEKGGESTFRGRERAWRRFVGCAFGGVVERFNVFFENFFPGDFGDFAFFASVVLRFWSVGVVERFDVFFENFFSGDFGDFAFFAFVDLRFWRVGVGERFEVFVENFGSRDFKVFAFDGVAERSGVGAGNVDSERRVVERTSERRNVGFFEPSRSFGD